MTRIAILIFCSFLFIKHSYCQTDVYTKAINNCFKIEGYKAGKLTKTGSGFILFQSQNNNYECLTNEHVLDNIDSAVLQFSNDKKYTIQGIRATFHNIDICYFSFSTKDLFDGVLTKNWAKQILLTNPSLGTNVITVSSPKGLLNTLSTGIISAFRKKDETNLIQITAPISPGSSGGLLADTKGNPIGVIVSHISEGQNLNFAISFRQILETLINRNLVTQELIPQNVTLYNINNLEKLIVESDEHLQQINKYLDSDKEYGNELLKQYDNDKLTSCLLFLKTSLFIDKGNWNKSFETLIFLKKKYDALPADFLLSTITSTIISKSNEIENIDNEYLLFLKENDDKYWEINYHLLRGSFNSYKEDYSNAIFNLTIVNNFIEKYFGDTDPQHFTHAFFSVLFRSSTLNRLGNALLITKDYPAAKKIFLRGVEYTALSKDNEGLKIFSKQYLSLAFLLDEYKEACFVYNNYLVNIKFSDNINYYINKYCK